MDSWYFTTNIFLVTIDSFYSTSVLLLVFTIFFNICNYFLAHFRLFYPRHVLISMCFVLVQNASLKLKTFIIKCTTNCKRNKYPGEDIKIFPNKSEILNQTLFFIIFSVNFFPNINFHVVMVIVVAIVYLYLYWYWYWCCGGQ